MEGESFTPERNAEAEPTMAELADACRGVLDDETIDFELSTSADVQDLYGALYGHLLEAGIDADEFFAAKGIQLSE